MLSSWIVALPGELCVGASPQIRLLFEAAPELDLAEFYMKHDKLPDAEAVLQGFIDELKGKVPPEDSVWLRTQVMLVSLRAQQKLWGNAVSVGMAALSGLTVRAAQGTRRGNASQDVGLIVFVVFSGR